MKPRPKRAAEDFIRGASATETQTPIRKSSRSRTTTGRGVMRGPDFQRVTVDLPKDLYKRLKIASVEQDKSMRECVEQAVMSWLNT